MSIIFLKIKIKSLAAEATMIRKERNKIEDKSSDIAVQLQFHRTWDVRNESRCANLAYGFLRNRTYHRLEAKCHTLPDWDKTEKMVLRFSSRPSAEKDAIKAEFKAWREAKIEVAKAA